MQLFLHRAILIIGCFLSIIAHGQVVHSYLSEDTGVSLFFEEPYVLQQGEVNSVKCIFKDSRHTMWFGTENGLYRYDGSNLHYFGYKAGDTSSLPDNNVLGIAEDKEGNLWISLLTGIAEINLTTLQCKTFTGANHRFNTGNYTNRICIDNEDNIWAGNNQGIFLFDKVKQIFANVWNDTLPGYSFSDYVTFLISANKHLLIASTFHDLIFFNKDNHSFKRMPLIVSSPPNDTSITTILLDSKQNLWVGTWGGAINMYDSATKKLKHVTTDILPFFYVTSFYETTSSNLQGAKGTQHCIWTSTNNGIIKISVDSSNKIEQLTAISHQPSANNYAIVPGKIESLYLDIDGALWCAGDNGVCKCFPFRNNFKNFAELEGVIGDIQPLKINYMANSHQLIVNSFFISSWNSPSGPGFLLVDSSGNKSNLNIDFGFTDKGESKNISGIIKDKYDRFWVSSTAGISILNEQFNVVHQWDEYSKGENNLTYFRTSGIAIHNDTVWVICYNKGVDLFDLSFKKLCHYTENDKSGLHDNTLNSIFTDSKGNLWICGSSQLYKYLPGSGTFKSYRLSSGMHSCKLTDITEAKNGNLFISSFGGIIQFDPKAEKYSYIFSDLLQREQNVTSVAVDKNDGIWFLTDKHLVHYNSSENRFILFGKEDGLDASKGMNLLRTFNGTDFYLCQDNRVIKFNCDSLNHAGTPPYMVLSMQINDSSIYRDDNSPVLRLPYNNNKLQFEFTGVSYIKADQNQYYYQLSGVDKQWNITYKNAVSYASLSPGSYSFKVKTINYAGLWSEEKSIHFIINPPYWRTWWFMLLSAFVILSLLFYIIRYIAQRNLKERILFLEKETAVEKERNRIANDMHDDLGSGLTKIAILSEVVKKNLKQPVVHAKLNSAVTNLERISDSSRTLVDNLQDIIWMLNTKHDQLESLAVYIREYAAKYFSQEDTFGEQSAINVSYDYPANIEPIKIPEEMRRNFFMAIKEALNNIVKHSEARNVVLKFRTERNIVTLVVSDDGKGFNTDETRKFANGVINMQNRMKQVGGECHIQSKPGKGTTITFTLRLS